MLHGYRALDLTSADGLLCGQLLADLGADVIQVEPPHGAAARRRGPFHPGRDGELVSLFWCAYARNKRSVTLDLDSGPARDELRRLVEDAHFLIEAEAPGAMASRGLDHAALSRINPALIHVSITPFGQDGPKARWAATDLTLCAAGGPLRLTGDPDRPPLRMSVPQAYHFAALDGAVGALVAHHERRRSGRGQHLDVSVQQSVMRGTSSMILASLVGDAEARRSGGVLDLGRIHQRMIWAVRDGHVTMLLGLGPAMAPFNHRLFEWIYQEGGCHERERDRDWSTFGPRLARGDEDPAEAERIDALVADFLASRTKAELARAARERGLALAPVRTVTEVLADPGLAASGFWSEQRDARSGLPMRFPGRFARFGEDALASGQPAPSLGGRQRPPRSNAPRPPRQVTGERRRGNADERDCALGDLRVLDFSWAIAGPSGTRILADQGATVVRVESGRRLDFTRTVQPYHGRVAGPENSAQFGNLNAGKLGVSLDLTRPQARAVVLDLARWADVVVETFSPGTLRRWGLDYPALRRENQGLVMVSSSLFGQKGPLAALAGFGNMAAAMAGFTELTGWPDRAPSGPFGSYTDYFSGEFIAAAVLAGLEHRSRTGRGIHVDHSQFESALRLLAPELLESSLTGRSVGRRGNRDPQMAPHGVYPAAGHDEWIALATRDDLEWKRFCGAFQQRDLAGDERFASLEARKSNEDALDRIVAAWTSKRRAADCEALLQGVGVPASVVQGSVLCADDPQLRHRRHFVALEHPIHGSTFVEGARFRLSRTPGGPARCAPTLGRDNDFVLRGILGYDEGTIEELGRSGALR